MARWNKALIVGTAALFSLATACGGDGLLVGPVPGLFSLLVLVLDVLAIINIVQSSQSTEKKILWIVLIVLLPVIGLILWYILGRG